MTISSQPSQPASHPATKDEHPESKDEGNAGLGKVVDVSPGAMTIDHNTKDENCGANDGDEVCYQHPFGMLCAQLGKVMDVTPTVVDNLAQQGSDAEALGRSGSKDSSGSGSLSIMQASIEAMNQRSSRRISGSNRLSIVKEMWQTSIETMRQLQQDRACRRKQDIQDLLGDVPGVGPELNQLHGFRCLLGIAVGMIVVTAGFASWPMKNPINHPDRWWECMLQCATIWTGITALFLTMTMGAILLGNFQLLPVRTLIIVSLTGSFVILSWWSMYYALWVPVLHLPYPAPWIGGTSGPLAFFAMAAAVCVTFPKAWRKDYAFWRQCLWMFACLSFYIITNITYWCLAGAFYFCNKYWPHLQWVLAFFVPVVRKMGVKLVTRTGLKAAGTNDVLVEIVLQHGVVCLNALFLSVCMTALARFETTVILLAIDFLMNLHSCYRVIQTGCGKTLLVMLLKESLQILLPLAYLVCFLVAFYGPNAHVLGNIKAEKWQYGKVDDDKVGEVVVRILVLAGLEALSLVIFTVAVWKFKRINVWKFFLYMQREMGFAFAAQQAFFLEQQFCTIAIGCAMDVTLKFLDLNEWPHN